MSGSKAEIIAKLQKDILPLHGFKKALSNAELDRQLGPMRNAFPDQSFPLGVLHEFISNSLEDNAATGGFVSSILSSLMRDRGIVIWISANRMIFPPALQYAGINADRVIFIELKKDVYGIKEYVIVLLEGTIRFQGKRHEPC